LLKIAGRFMGEMSTLVTGIEWKVRKLTEMLRHHEAECRQLQDERSKLLATVTEQQTHIRQLEEKYKKLQMAEALTRNEDTAGVKLKINELVREVDRCIALLDK
jgi:septal ring factor EnvC (AmiA/AmiB activator)